MMMLWQDVRYGLRMLARRPGFALLVVAILAMGIGANTAVFTVVNTVLLKALPFAHPGRIVEIRELERDRRARPRSTSAQTLAYWREHNQVFDHIAGRVHREMCLTGLGEAFRVSVRAVSPCYFSLVGVPPKLGREFLPAEEQLGHHHVTVVSHAFWRDRLGGNRQAIGTSLTADGENYTVIGIMPDDFRDTLGQTDIAFWVPLVLDSANREEYMTVWARLKLGVRTERARADMAVLERQLAQADPPSYSKCSISVERLVDSWFGSEREILYPLWGAVALVLLIACANVGGLFLVQADARRQEMAMRVTLGASRGRILCQLLTESLLRSLPAGLCGILVAFSIIKGIVAVCPADIAQIGQTHIDRTVLFFTLALSLLTGLLSGLLPAWRAANTRRVRTSRQESAGPVLDRGWRHLCGGLVVTQIALAVTLLVGVGMLVQSLVLLQGEDLGFQPGKVAVLRLSFPASKYPRGPQAAALLHRLLRRVQTLPGVRSAAVISPNLLLGSGANFMPLTIDGHPPDPERTTSAKIQMVSSDFFAALGMRVLAGRSFTPEDMQGPEKGVIIDENLARRFFTRQNPIGRQIAVGGWDRGPILGVVSCLKDYRTLNPDLGGVYWPLSEEYCWSCGELVVKGDGDPLRLVGTVRALAADLDKDLKIDSIKMVEETLSAMLAPQCFDTVLLGMFALIALLVAAIGLYGLLQYSVVRRTQEIGVRIALGATPNDVIRTVLRQGGLLIVLGIGLGLAGGHVMSQTIASLLYRSRPTDPLMLVFVLTTLFAAGLAACYIPARRAAKIDPMEAIRRE
jgi:putative ABC transport system permease protein